jgi:hypothetical protein
MEGENRVNRLRYREKREEERHDIYTRVARYFMSYRLCALISAQLKLSSVRSICSSFPDRRKTKLPISPT